MKVRTVDMGSWDFTLYEAQDGSNVLKVMFSEGYYKIDVERYFVLDAMQSGAMTTEDLKHLAAEIRVHYPQVSYAEIPKSALTIQT